MNQLQLFDDSEVKDDDYRNPMVVLYGKGPEGSRCKTCEYLCTIQPGQNTYYKCQVRGITHGPGTDHRVNYRACKKYQPEVSA